jgi:hypothetical protein
VPVAVAARLGTIATYIIQGQLREIPRRDLCQIVGNASGLSLKNFKPGPMKAIQGTSANSTDHNSINCLPCEGFEGLALAMTMTLILVGLFIDFACFCIDH